MNRLYAVSSSLLASVSEQGRGIMTTSAGRQPPELLELYDMEGCPYCRVVREALTDLDLDALIYPCPKGGIQYRELLEKLGGKQQFPFLMDPNTDEAMYESSDIVDYLYTTYGNKSGPARWRLRLVRTPVSMTTSMLRPMQGLRARHSQPPLEPLALYSFEASPFARLVRERLCELEIPYILRQTGRTHALDWVPPAVRERIAPDYQPSQRNRVALMQSTGKVSVPYLIDPNTETELFESEQIIDYLDSTYGA